jgi:HAD superfamily phosphoserine phosphatase-like hydrolase
MMDLALFDLDNTLIAGDSDFEWAQFLIAKGILDRALYEARNIEFYEQYKAGTLDIDVFLDFQLQPLSRYPRALLDTWRREFMSRHILPLVGDKARALVREHRERGALCAIVTATNSFVTGPIIHEFGIAHLIATIPAQVNGQFTGTAAGHAIVSRRQDHPRRKLARGDGPLVEQFRALVVLQRLAKRPAAAVHGQQPGGRRSRPYPVRTRGGRRMAGDQPPRLSNWPI